MAVHKGYFELSLFLAVALALIGTLLGIAPVFTSALQTYTNSVGLNEVVPGTCIPTIANTLITFPSTPAGQNAPTANAENIINVGNAASNILVFGVNWISATAAFHVSNTLWNPASSSTAAIGNELTNTAVDTQILLKANSGANVIFFGLNIPSGQAAATYNQAITIESSC